MNPKQLTFGDLIQKEAEMVLDGEELYGDFFVNAHGFSLLFNNFIKPKSYLVQNNNVPIFLMFFSQIRKHHILAFLSASRRHHIQTLMNLRQVLESGLWAAYSIGNQNLDQFCTNSNQGTEVPKPLKERCYKWIKQHNPSYSDEIKNLKKKINETAAHSYIFNTQNNFQMPLSDTGGVYSKIVFFDECDEYYVKQDLFLVGRIARIILELFNSLNTQYKAFQLVDSFQSSLQELALSNNQLYLELQKMKNKLTF